jgi:hypothetical protein
MFKQSRIASRAGCVAVGLMALGSGRLYAAADAPLDPNAFASLGTLSGGTSYVFNTGNGISTPTLTVDGTTTINGVISNGVAVFDFSNINLSTGSSATGTGALRLALLSRGGATLNGTIDVSASGGTPGAGGGAGGTGGAGGGPGASAGSTDGAGFGAPGSSPGPGTGTVGGPAYGDPTHVFFGGSGGSGAGGAVGGGGGGGIEISTLGDISLLGFGTADRGILADGSVGTATDLIGAGGGSGGGVFLATPGQINLNNTVEADGAFPGFSADATPAGGGGGGRILLEASNVLATAFVQLNVQGGTNYLNGAHTPGLPGGFGTVEVTGYVAPVPEPGIAALLIGAGISMLTRRRRLVG